MSKINIFLVLVLIGQTLLAQNTKSKEDGVFLSLPKEIVIIEGDKLEIFKHSIVHAINPDNYFLSIGVINGTPKGYFYDRKFEYDCQIGDDQMTLNFILKNNNLEVIDSRSVTIIPVSKVTVITNNLNVLIIGDSFTSNPIYPNELARRLKGNEGIPAPDALKNINFIGFTPDDDNIPREGHTGKSWSYFLQNESPFWNDKTNSIDFKNYCIQHELEKIDAAKFLLGTNDISNNETVSKFFDALIAYNPSIKVLVTGKILSTPFGGTGSVGLIANQYYFSSVKISMDYNRRMEDLIAEKYTRNLKFVDILPSFDTDYNMRYKQVPVNSRNQTLIKQGIDNVHPDDTGYLQIADIIYSAFHHFIIN